MSNDKTAGAHGVGKPLTNLKAVKGKRFIGVKFDCCQVYARIYINNEGTSYEGRCPGCLREISVKIRKDGVNCRFFSAF